jgi:carbon-monoxide dehydrogenase catalytic subunit
VAADLGVETDGREVNAIAEEVGQIVLAQFGQQEGELAFLRRAPQTRQKIWRKTSVASRGIDREIVETLSRVNMGMDQDYRSIMRQVSRCALSDGWGGSMIATELQDILLGTPIPTRGKANFGVLKEDYVNLVVHGHEPLLSDPLVAYTSTQEVKDLCEKVGAKGVNVVGVCCTANEVLMRHGVPLAGSFAQQELLLTTGVIDAMVVDIQCIMQSLPEIAEKYHTEIITTSGQAHIPGSTYIEFTEENAQDAIKEIVQRAVLNFKNRKSPAFIPDDSMDLIAGFSFETLKYIQGGSFRASFRPLNDNIIKGRIRGVAAVVGCDSPQIREGAREGEAHVALVRELIKNDVLVVQTGCSAIPAAKQGLLLPEAMAWAGPGLREVCEALGIPPVLHAGSCVDNSRILIALTEMVKEGGLGEDISDLPAAGAAPDWINAKALAIGEYFVASGCLVVVRPELPIRGSEVFSKYLLEEYDDIYGGRWAMATTPKEMAEIMIAHIDSKRKTLGIDKKRERILYDMAMRRELRV